MPTCVRRAGSAREDLDVVDIAGEVVAGDRDVVAVELAADRQRLRVADAPGRVEELAALDPVDGQRRARGRALAADHVPLAVVRGDRRLDGRLAAFAHEEAVDEPARVLDLPVAAFDAVRALLDD